MIIIIEGLDGVGKTTLAKEIEKRTKCIYIKESYTDNIKEKEKRIVRFSANLLEKNKIYLYDRTTLIDDFVYNFLNKTPSSLIDHAKIIRFLLEQATIFHLELNEKVRSRRFEERGDQYIDNGKIEKIRKEYERFYKEFGLQPNRIVLSGNLEEDTNLLIKEIEYYDKSITHSIK